MPIYTLKLLQRREVANGTTLFEFEKPPGFTFKPGQYAGFTLINPKETDSGGITRRFSLLSTPSSEHLAIAMRIQNNNNHSAYKRNLFQLEKGAAIKFAGPTGTFVLHDDIKRPAVLIAGGIGITPFYCMIKDACEQQSPRQILLFYGNQSPAEAAFLEELNTLQTQNPNFKMVATMANANGSWQGETGFITDTMIRKYIQDLDAPIYYICGSPVMVTTLQETLAEMGVNEDNIKIEDFPGY